MRTRWSTLADTVAEVEAVGDTRGHVHALVETPADPVAEVDAVTIDDTQGDTHALVDTPAYTLAEAVVDLIGDKPGDTHALVETGCHASRGGGSRRHTGR